jgi:hypothetical protein
MGETAKSIPQGLNPAIFAAVSAPFGFAQGRLKVVPFHRATF